MPEVRFTVRWPDGTTRACYSPSTVIRDYLAPGESLPVSGFVSKATAGLEAASGRVAARYGSPCSIAAAEIADIVRIAEAQDPQGSVTVVSLG